MFSGSVARGSRQLLSQMNDHRRVEGNRNAEQDSAYDLLLRLFIPLLKGTFAILAKILGSEGSNYYALSLIDYKFFPFSFAS